MRVVRSVRNTEDSNATEMHVELGVCALNYTLVFNTSLTKNAR